MSESVCVISAAKSLPVIAVELSGVILLCISSKKKAFRQLYRLPEETFGQYTNKTEREIQVFMDLLVKVFFIFLAIGGITLVFFVSWFWRALIIPMVILLMVDVLSSFLKKKKVKK